VAFASLFAFSAFPFFSTISSLVVFSSCLVIILI
jgi:hypothetical protein